MDSKTAFLFASRFWPGLHLLWLKGDVHSLLVSLLFAWVFGLTWLASFVWPEWLSTYVGPDWLAKLLLFAVWLALGIASVGSAVKTSLASFTSSPNSSTDRQSNLMLAQEYYLQANYFDAERLVRKNNVLGAHDIEASILWISILRRTKRITQALEMISNLE
ncbi:MAG: hypothetical protein ABL921_32415, partial [Pirellula sp.]